VPISATCGAYLLTPVKDRCLTRYLHPIVMAGAPNGVGSSMATTLGGPVRNAASAGPACAFRCNISQPRTGKSVCTIVCVSSSDLAPLAVLNPGSSVAAQLKAGG
jgi:hypothetical protein